MRLVTMLCIAAAAVASLLPFAATSANAADTKIFRLVYPIVSGASGSGEQVAGPGGARSCVGTAGLAFAGTGPEATILNITILDEPGICSLGIPMTLGGDWQIDWATDCVNPTDFVLAEFSTPKGPITIERAYWANALGDSIAPVVVEEVGVPSTSANALIVLMAALALAGVGFIARLRTGVTSG